MHYLLPVPKKFLSKQPRMYFGTHTPILQNYFTYIYSKYAHKDDYWIF